MEKGCDAGMEMRDHEEVLAQIMQMDAEIQQAESLLQDIYKAPSDDCCDERPIPALSSLADLLRDGADGIKARRSRLSNLLAEIRDALGLSEQINPPAIATGSGAIASTGRGFAVRGKETMKARP